MFKKLARSASLGAVAASAAAAGIGVGAFALYAALKDPLGQAAAAAIVAALFLLVALVAALMLRGGSDKKTAAQPAGIESSPMGGISDLRDRALTLAKQRPMVAGAVGVVGALYVLRNPALVSALIAALAGRAEGKAEERRSSFF